MSGLSWRAVNMPFGATKYKAVLAELAGAGCDVSAVVNVPLLYLVLAGHKGYDLPPAFVPPTRQSIRALRMYKEAGVLVNLGKRVPFHAVKVDDLEDVMAVAAQTNRSSNIIRLFAEQKGKCHYCECDMRLPRTEVDRPEFATIDHVVPCCQGGTRARSNTVAACKRCNGEKGKTGYQAFVALKAAR
jgi:5-methylcytosine-specific restriction endonuclease McrA